MKKKNQDVKKKISCIRPTSPMSKHRKKYTNHAVSIITNIIPISYYNTNTSTIFIQYIPHREVYT